MYRYERPVNAGETTASTPEAWARNFAASTRMNWRKRWRLRVTLEARLIRRYIRRGATILDAGCGFGEWVTYLGSIGYHAIGCDYSPELIRRLGETYPAAEWIRSDIRSLPQGNGAVDAIVSWGVIEHDEAGPAAALREFRRVLRSGGIAIVTVPIDSRWARQAAAVRDRVSGREHAFFQYLMSEEELRREGAAAGFEILESGTLPAAHLNHVAPRLSLRLRGIAYRAADFAAYLFLSWMKRYRVMLYVVMQKPK